jgi:hypothetical protein
VYIHDGKIDLINSSGVTTGALDGNGINATSITVGQLPGGSNAIPNSSFELAGFGVPISEPIYGPGQSSPTLNYTTSISASTTISPNNVSVAVSGVITAVSVSSPNITVTCSPHSFAEGDYVTISGIVGTGASLNLVHQQITLVTGTTSFRIAPPTASFPTGGAWVSGGRVYRDQIDQTSYGW